MVPGACCSAAVVVAKEQESSGTASSARSLLPSLHSPRSPSSTTHNAPAQHDRRTTVRPMASAASDWLKQDKRRLLHVVYRVGDMQVRLIWRVHTPRAHGTHGAVAAAAHACGLRNTHAATSRAPTSPTHTRPSAEAH